MRKSVFLFPLFLVFLYATNTYAFGGCEAECGKCHALSLPEAEGILARMKVPDAKVIGVEMSPVKGLWSVTVEKGGKKGVVYVGFSKKYIVGGPIYEVDSAENKTGETTEELNRPPDRYVNASTIPLEESLTMGDPEAPVKVVVFTDPECPYCQKLHGELKKIIADRKDIAFYLKLMPLKFHRDAYWKSQSILCEHSLRRLEENFEKKQIPKPDCDTREPDDNIRLAGELSITGTPTLVMPDGFVLVGGRDAGALTDIILKHRGNGG